MGTHRKRLLAKLGLFCGSGALALVACELMLRLFLPVPERVGHTRLFCQYDPLLGWSKVPNKVGTHSKREYSVTEVFNSRGIRGPEYRYEKGPDEWRILVLGDSFAEGYTVEFEDLLSEVLKRRLNETADKYCEVINAGTGGYSTDQELLFFQNEGVKYRPDLVILVFCVNDVWFNAQAAYLRGPKPLFSLENGTLRLTNVPVPEVHFAGPKRVLADHSHLYRLTRDTIKSRAWLHRLSIKIGLATPLPVEENDPRGEVLVPKEWWVFKKEYAATVQHAWQLTEALLVTLKEEIDSVGARLLVFYVPPRDAIYVDGWVALNTKYEMSEDEWDIDRVAKHLGDVCERAGIEYIDPTSDFRSVAATLSERNERLYFVRDGHWNRHGHELVGEMLAGYVIGLPWARAHLEGTP